jgi:putative endonuclease
LFIARIAMDTAGKLQFYVYILKCRDGSFYTGYTKDLTERTRQHQTGKGARYTKAHPPIGIAYVEMFESRSQAMKREREIKKLSHQQKQALIASNGTKNR